MISIITAQASGTTKKATSLATPWRASSATTLTLELFTSTTKLAQISSRMLPINFIPTLPGLKLKVARDSVPFYGGGTAQTQLAAMITGTALCSAS